MYFFSPDEKLTGRSRKKGRTAEQKIRAAASQKTYYANRKDDPEYKFWLIFHNVFFYKYFCCNF